MVGAVPLAGPDVVSTEDLHGQGLVEGQQVGPGETHLLHVPKNGDEGKYLVATGADPDQGQELE